ncbi:MAG: hypothetical protein JNK09_08280 [Prolixibacteraceae bacterium]|nr:hypothetical protein [Prolixibacteraceae bacterium]
MTSKTWDIKDFIKRIKKDLNLTYFLCLTGWTIACLLFSKPINLVFGKLGGSLFFEDQNSLLVYLGAIAVSYVFYLFARVVFFGRFMWGQFPITKFMIPIAIWYFINVHEWVKPTVSFVELPFFESLNFLSLTYLFCIVDLLFMVVYYLKKTEILPNEKSSFITDIAFDPEKEEQKDLLGFKPFAERMVAEIKTVSSSESVVFGINGEWGEGKTSMINMIRKQLEDDNYMVVDFHPWKTNSGKAMNQLFFDALKDGLQNKIIGIGINWKIDRYADALLQLDKTGIGKAIWQLISQPDSVEKQKKKLAESMKLLDKSLVVVVDDLDRLAKNEIADVLKLIRDTANFPNLVFLAAYDRAYLDEAIKSEINPHNYQNYMDKIVLWEAPIYRPQPSRYVEILKSYFQNGYQRHNIEINSLMERRYSKKILTESSSLPQVANPPFYEVLEYCFNNLREIKRFYNSFSFEFKVLEKKGVDFHDFFCLALMKFISKDYYNRFKTVFYEINRSTLEIIINDQNKYISAIGSSNAEKYLENILVKLIKYPTRDHPGSFSRYSNWPLYFYVGNNDEMTPSEMAVMLNSPNFEAFKDNLNKYVEIINKFEMPEILEIIYESQNSFLENCKRIIWFAIHFDSFAIYNRILNFLRNKEGDNANYSSQLIDFIKEEKIEKKSIKIIDLIINKRKNEINENTNDLQEFCIDIKSAISYCRIEFIGLLKTTEKITLRLINLYILSFQHIDEKSDMIQDQEIIQLMRERVYKLPDEFLMFVVFDKLMLSPRDETEFSFNDSLLSIFKNKQEFIEFLNPDKYKTEKKRAKIFLKYAKENIKEDLACLSFKINDYNVRTDFFEDLLGFKDFFETQKWDQE